MTIHETDRYNKRRSRQPSWGRVGHRVSDSDSHDKDYWRSRRLTVTLTLAVCGFYMNCGYDAFDPVHGDVGHCVLVRLPFNHFHVTSLKRKLWRFNQTSGSFSRVWACFFHVLSVFRIVFYNITCMLALKNLKNAAFLMFLLHLHVWPPCFARSRKRMTLHRYVTIHAHIWLYMAIWL